MAKKRNLIIKDLRVKIVGYIYIYRKSSELGTKYC